MDKTLDSSSYNRAQRLYDKNIELENRRRKAAQAKVPSDPNAWQQMRENFETIILEDHSFSEKHSIEFALWQLHYRRIEEFRAHYNAASAATDSTTSRGVGGPARALKIRSQFKTFLSEATGFYHDLILKIRAKYGLPMGQFYPELENHKEKDGKIKKGLISCHRCFIYLGDLARYKGLYGEGESKSRDYAAASSYYLQAASLWPSSGNSHHQLAILATYSGDELMAVYRYFRSLAAENPFSTARDNLIVAFEKNRQTYNQLHLGSKSTSFKKSPVRARIKPKGKVDSVVRSKESVADVEKVTGTRSIFKAFRVRFVRLNGILFTRTSLETFEEILSLVTSALQELLSGGPEDELKFGTDAAENRLFIVMLVSILIFTVNNVKGGTEGQSYADIVQNALLLKNALVTFYEIMCILFKRCLQVTDLSSSFLLPGILICVEWIACHPDVVRNEIDEKRSTAQIEFWRCCISLFNKLLSAGLVTYDDDNDDDDDDDDDTSCFTDMMRYEEGGNDHQPAALWEDFELRGFLPLQPAQMFLDFSRMCSDSKKDKVARVKRILTAGKVVADMITVDQKVRFDSKLKKFVIGVDSPKSNGAIKESVSDASANVIVKQSKVEDVEGDEEDEVILFRPNLIDNRSEMLVSKENLLEGSEQIQNNDVGTSQFAAPVSVPVTDFNAVHTSLQSPLPVNSYTQSTRQLVNSYPQSSGQPVNSYPQSTGQVVNSNPQSTGQLVNTNPQSTGQVGNSYPQSTGQVVNSYPQSTGQPVNSYPQRTGQPVNSNPQSTGQVVNSYPQSTGQPVNSYPQSSGQPVNSYTQSMNQSVNGYIQSMGQQQGNNFNQSNISQSYQFQSPMWPHNSVGSGLQGLSLQENGQLGQTAMHRDFQLSNVTGLREGGMMYTGTSLVGPTVIDREAITKINTVPPSGPDPYLVGRTINSSMPTSSLKLPINRPVRHLGPPPGFGSVRSKQVSEHEHVSGSGQNPLNDDYSWLDGYQLQSSLKAGFPINLPPSMGSATPTFPFPGKQGPMGQFVGDGPNNMESLDFQSLQQQQHLPQVDPQGQPMWKGNQFV